MKKKSILGFIVLLLLTSMMILPTQAAGKYLNTVSSGSSSFRKAGKLFDPSGRKYTNCVKIILKRSYSKEQKASTSATYKLNKKYKKLAGTFMYESSDLATRPVTVAFYGDGKLLKKCNISYTTCPKKFSVNVKGVKKLKIKVSDLYKARGTMYLGLASAKLS